MKRAVLLFLLCAPTAFGAAATKFIVSTPPITYPGVPFDVTVTATDTTDTTDTNFAGTIHFASSSAGTLPADYTFVADDHGSRSWSVTLMATGQQSITVTCGPINGHTYTIVSPPPTFLGV